MSIYRNQSQRSLTLIKSAEKLSNIENRVWTATTSQFCHKPTDADKSFSSSQFNMGSLVRTFEHYNVYMGKKETAKHKPLMIMATKVPLSTAMQSKNCVLGLQISSIGKTNTLPSEMMLTPVTTNFPKTSTCNMKAALL